MNEVMVNEERGMAVRNSQTEMMVNRQAQEVQAAMVIAKRFPRNEVDSFNRILRSCQRKSLAETATYEYPRGGAKVTGPSIRLAEAMAQNWGNIDFGITELEQSNGESQVMAYAWDLETNTRQTKIFTVPHIRGTKKGNIPLTDPMALAKIRGEYRPAMTKAMLTGSFVDTYFEGTLDSFMKEHPEVFTRKKELRSEYRKANEIIQRVTEDKLFAQFMSGEKQRIMTFEMFGVPWKMKMDSYLPGICITDLKVVANFRSLPLWRYAGTLWS